MLKSMPRSAAKQPNIIYSRMPIHNEVTVRSLLVLADARLDQWSVFHRWKTEGNILANTSQRRVAHNSFARGGIEVVTARVIGDLEAASIAAWNTVEEALAVVAPDGKLRVGEAGISGGRAEEKNVLLGGSDDIS